MARKTDLKDILFPVELHAVYAEIPQGETTRKVMIPSSQVVINKASGCSLGVVSKGYQLVTNEQAIELGKECCQELLGLEDTASLVIFSVYAPSTLSYCHIDLVHKGFEMNLFDGSGKPEVYLPIVRVTNSYNTIRALRFDIGLCRKLCLNGTIFESETIRFVYSHVKHSIRESINFEIEKGKMQTLIAEFKNTMQLLKDFPVRREDAKHVFDIILSGNSY